MRRVSCITGVVVRALLATLAGCGDGGVCHTNELDCDGQCIAPASDDANCGACGSACGSGATCQAGACIGPAPACDAPMLLCGSDCIDPTTTSAHCGTCAIACMADNDCIAGHCDAPLAVVQTSGSAARDAFVLQDGTYDLTQLDASTFATDRVIDSAILPSGSVVLVAADDTEGVFELYLASPDSGALTKLSPPQVTGGTGVRAGIAVSRDGTKILYRADQDTAGVVELYAITVAAPGTSVKVSGALAAGGGVSRVLAIAGDGHRAAYVADEDTPGLEEAYTVDLSAAAPGAAVKINPAVTTSVFDLAMTDDGSKIVYRAPDVVDGPAQLSEVDVATPGVAHRIADADGSGSFVTDYQLTSDGAVVYTGSTEQLAQQLWRAPLVAPFAATLLVPDTDGFVREFVVSHDGSAVFYRLGQALFRVPVAAPSTPVQLSLQTETSADLTTDFALAANDHAIAFRSGADGAEGGFSPTPGTVDPVDPNLVAPAIYVLDLTGSGSAATPVLISPTVADGHAGVYDGYVVTPDERVIYRADQNTIGVIDAWLAAAATGESTIKVSPALDAGSDSDAVSRLLAYP